MLFQTIVHIVLVIIIRHRGLLVHQLFNSTQLKIAKITKNKNYFLDIILFYNKKVIVKLIYKVIFWNPCEQSSTAWIQRKQGTAKSEAPNASGRRLFYVLSH